MVTGETCQVLSFSFYKKFKWNLVLFTSYSNLRKFPVLIPDYHTLRQKSPCSDKFNFQCLWPIEIRGSHITRAFWHFKHSYDTVYITVMFVSVLQPNMTLYLSIRRGFIRGVLIYRRSRVYEHYTRQYCPMGITESILQYYYGY